MEKINTNNNNNELLTFLHKLVVLAHVVRPDRAEEANVFIAMVFCHFLLRRLVRPVDLHTPVESIVKDEVMRHTHPMGLHRMPLAIVVITDVT